MRASESSIHRDKARILCPFRENELLKNIIISHDRNLGLVVEPPLLWALMVGFNVVLRLLQNALLCLKELVRLLAASDRDIMATVLQLQSALFVDLSREDNAGELTVSDSLCSRIAPAARVIPVGILGATMQGPVPSRDIGGRSLRRGRLRAARDPALGTGRAGSSRSMEEARYARYARGQP